MGIQGLLPFLKKIHSPVNVSQYAGCTVAVDAYCWLHRGAFSCADKLAMGEKTEQYVYYCMKYVNYLLSKDIKPVLVFDGQHLPSKRDVEKTRRERREINRKKAAQFLREGKRAEARDCFQKCVDITPEMALQLMKACRAKGVDCIVAPYEADAQLAYLNKAGIAQVIITEDSDLLLFGCDKIIFKMDFYGNGVQIDRSRLNEVMEMRAGYTFEKFRYTCILSGCDYLPSLPGIGLAKACKVFKTARQPDLKLVLKKIPSYLNLKIVVSEEYIEGFMKADNTFLYQLAFDPRARRLVPLTPYPEEIEPAQVAYAGPYFAEEQAYQIALGNWNIYSHQMMDDFNPLSQKKTPKKLGSEKFLSRLSIWDPNYRPLGPISALKEVQMGSGEPRPSTLGKERVVHSRFKHTPTKRSREETEKEDELTVDEIAETCAESLPPKRVKVENEDVESDQLDTKVSKPAPKRDSAQLWDIMQQEDKENSVKSLPVVSPRRNKFAVSPRSQKKDRFDLNAATQPSAVTKTEVKSRFFKCQSRLKLSKGPAVKEASGSQVGPGNVVDQDNSSENFFEKDMSEVPISDYSTNSVFRHKDSSQENSTTRRSSSTSVANKNSPSAFSWSKFKFAKLNNGSSGDSLSGTPNSKLNSQFKCVVSREHSSQDSETDESEQIQDVYKKAAKMGHNASDSGRSNYFSCPTSSQCSSAVSSQEDSTADSQSCKSETNSEGESTAKNPGCKFYLGACSVSDLTVDLTESLDADNDDDGKKQRFSSQGDFSQCSSVSKKTAGMLTVSPPAKRIPSTPSSCRVSGLSRNKGKNSSLSKSSSTSDSQRSIKSMFAKFAHKSKSVEKLDRGRSEEDINSTPVTSSTDLRRHSNLSRQIIS